MSLARCAPIPLSKVALIARGEEKPDREGDGSDGREIREGRFVLIRAIRNERLIKGRGLELGLGGREGWGFKRGQETKWGLAAKTPTTPPPPSAMGNPGWILLVSLPVL